MQILIPVLVGIGFVGAGVLILFFGIRALTVSEVSQRLNEFVTVQTTQISAASTIPVVQRSDIKGSFRSRVVEPYFFSMSLLQEREMRMPHPVRYRR